ncbi:MAG: hypothetical protein KAJ19_20520, partial [Gammaproteobacteria bacterium]|nr:hypothetical protein [Gammaproteobacteria bacterium]
MKPGQAITFPEGTARPFTRFGQDIPTFTDRNTENQRLDIGPTSDLSQELGGPPGVINQVGGSASGRDVGLYSLFHPFNTGFAAIALRPQLWLKGAPNFEHNPLLNSRVYREEERTRPTVLTIRAWGAQNSSGDWDYIESPVSSRARGGNVNGGILIAPAEFEMEDYLGINSQADTDSPAASTYVTFAPTVAVAFGKPATTGRPSASSKIIHQDTAIGKLVVSGITDTAGSTTDILKMSLDADISQGFVEFEGTGAAKLPSGTTAQRPSTVASGMVRMNSTLTALEFYNGSAWVAVGDLTHQARLYGVLQTEGTDPPTLESNGLNIASVSRTAIGKYTFTFDAGLGLTANAYCAKLGAAI